MTAIVRAWAKWDIKALDDEQRRIEGTATTPSTDRMDDIVDPKGAQYALPLPLLWQHWSERPIGHVVEAKVTAKGIDVVAQIARGGVDFIDEAWELIKRGLVQGFSIGFRDLESERIEGSDWGRHFKKWEWLELSAVTIPANQDASITSIKALDLQQMRAASGAQAPLPVVRLGAFMPGVAGEKPYVIRRIHPL